MVDEAQDISIAQLRFLAALGGGKPNALFFAGDLGQRIFQQPFSWKALGVDIRGRSKTLRVNYRTSHQIREQADRLLGPEITDVDGNLEERRHTVSVFNGPAPLIRIFRTEAEESEAVGAWLRTLTAGWCAASRDRGIREVVRSGAESDGRGDCCRPFRACARRPGRGSIGSVTSPRCTWRRASSFASSR